MTAQNLIAESARQDRIVTVAYSAELAADLAVLADDYVLAFSQREFWGRDAEGDTWRVHLSLAEVE